MGLDSLTWICKYCAMIRPCDILPCILEVLKQHCLKISKRLVGPSVPGTWISFEIKGTDSQLHTTYNGMQHLKTPCPGTMTPFILWTPDTTVLDALNKRTDDLSPLSCQVSIFLKQYHRIRQVSSLAKLPNAWCDEQKLKCNNWKVYNLIFYSGASPWEIHNELLPLTWQRQIKRKQVFWQTFRNVILMVCF